MRVVLVSGGVISGIGKGQFPVSSSSGLLLKTAGLRVTAIKIDPYLNVDAGTLGPLEHGECFVLADGGESDLDLGNYERYLDIQLTRDNNITTGKVYQAVIEKERRGDYLGRTVQVVPHIVQQINDTIERVAKIPVDDSGAVPDVCIIELGGTIGDLESGPFVEALVQLRHKLVRDPESSFFNIHVSFVPLIHGEEKTKPTQHAIRQLRSSGLVPDLVACRCDASLDQATINKIAFSCQVDLDQVIGVHDMETIYQVPVLLEEQGLLTLLRKGLDLDRLPLDAARKAEGAKLWDLWQKTIDVPKNLPPVELALVGKYTSHMDSYLSTVKALEHASMHVKRKLNLTNVDSEHLEESMLQKDPSKYKAAWAVLDKVQGIIVPGGFGNRGIEGMIATAKFARQKKIPYLGICLGLQVAVIEAVRDLLNKPNATSEEFHENAETKAVIFMPEGSKEKMGGTMRLGTRPTHFQVGTEWSKLRGLYGGLEVIDERHRHRYEVNPDLVDELESKGFHFVAKDDTGNRMEAFELKDHPYFVGLQAHPEYRSKVTRPSPPFLGFVASSAGLLDKVLQEMAAEKVVVNGHRF
ncbi:CTP synthase N-terminus-domain-containing protein [Apiosordaria backusii]|uniref:CTP synthase n=1 Tax=Apiosordaria backusii TaxID=314023 RepID=A0AA40EDE1_9PEZI|nr:CTP synthase N-terminus-domain-containing protein [Apiosordaria backusii]